MWGEQLLRLASRIAVNRTVAGVHFPADSAAGATLGLTLGSYFVGRCKGDRSYTAWKFDGPRFEGDFKWRAIFRAMFATQKEKDEKEAESVAADYIESLGSQDLEPDHESPVLKWLWEEAKKEWFVPPSA
jgi:hypothetical protein